MTRVVIDQQRIQQANGVTTAAADGQIAVGPGGRLKAASLEMAVGTGPVYATLAFIRGPTGMNLIKGWVRGPSVFGDTGGLSWYGDLPLGDAGGIVPLFQARFQVRTGSAETLFIEWVIEHETRVVEDGS